VAFPSPIELSAAARRAVEFEPALRAADAAQLARAGWWIVPLGRRRDEIFGIRIVPEKALADCPVVRLIGTQAQTMVSRPAHFLSRLLYPGTTVSVDAWKMSVDAADAAWDELVAADRALGGNGLAAAQKLLHDDAVRDASLFSTPPQTFLHALPDIATRLDPTAETRRYYDYMKSIVLDDGFAAPPDGLGAWTTAAWAAAFGMAHGGDADPEAVEWAERFFVEPHGLDCFQGDLPRFAAKPDGSSDLLLHAAGRIAKGKAAAAWKKDPRWPAVRALADGDGAQAGASWLEAAQALAKKGKRTDAFAALVSASYWLASSGADEPRVEVAEAAQLLASDAKWAHTEAALAHVADLVNDA
jgi:hypothetical protein